MAIRWAMVRACGVAAAAVAALIGGAAAAEQRGSTDQTAAATERAAREAAGEIETGPRAEEGALSYAGWALIGEGPAAADGAAPSGDADASDLRAWEALPEGAAFTPRRAQVTLLDGEASVAVRIVGVVAPSPSAADGDPDHQILLSEAAGAALGRALGERFLIIVETAAPAKP